MEFRVWSIELVLSLVGYWKEAVILLGPSCWYSVPIKVATPCVFTHSFSVGSVVCSDAFLKNLTMEFLSLLPLFGLWLFFQF